VDLRALLYDPRRRNRTRTRHRQALRGTARWTPGDHEPGGPRYHGAGETPRGRAARGREQHTRKLGEPRMNGPTVLIVDDERTLARAIRTFLSEQGYEVEVAEDAEKALGLLGRLHPDVVFTDVRLPGIGGLELLKRIREFDSAISVVVMTAFGSIEGAVEAVKLGAFDYVKKPLDLEEIKLLADRARETSLLKQELSYYRERAEKDAPFEGMLGR